MTSTGLHDLLVACHRWETVEDPDGRKLPRAKHHEDKTIASVNPRLM